LIISKPSVSERRPSAIAVVYKGAIVDFLELLVFFLATELTIGFIV